MTREITPQDRGGEQWLDFNTLQVPYDLGLMEFTPTQEMFDRYVKVIGDADSAYLTHSFRASTMITGKLAPRPGEAQVNAGHEAEYFNRPVPGKKLIMTGAIVDKYVKRDLPYIVIQMEASDEDGRKIESVRHITMLRASSLGQKWWGKPAANAAVGKEPSAGTGQPMPAGTTRKESVAAAGGGVATVSIVKRFTKEDIMEAEEIAALFGRTYENIHSDEEAAKREGLNEIIASGNDMTSHIHELLKKFAGRDWIHGGTISVRFIRPVVGGDTVTYKGTVTGKTAQNGRTRIMLDVVGEKQTGEAVLVGKASVLG